MPASRALHKLHNVMGYKGSIRESVTIEAVAAEGRCTARIDGITTFMKGVAPGDVVDVRITAQKKNYLEAVVTAFRNLSRIRVDPFCSHFGVCGGCQWQHLPYIHQTDFKRQQVIDQLQRIGKIEGIPVNPTIPSLQDRRYRNKLEFAFSTRKWLTAEQMTRHEDYDRRALGFHVPGRFDAVIDIDHCHLQDEPSNAIRNGLRHFAIEHDLDFYDLKRHEGFLRGLVIRNNRKGEFMVLVQFARNDMVTIEAVMNYLSSEFVEINSLHYVINTKKNDSYYDLPAVLWSGKPWLIENCGPLTFRIGPKSFFQTNPEQAEQLFSASLDIIGFRGHERVLDLYTGTGTIALTMALRASEVTGIDVIPEAIEDARRNACDNNLKNVRFLCGDLSREEARRQLSDYRPFDLVVTDPPRAGMHPDVIAYMLQLKPERILYISCNPATQARDLQCLADHYRPSVIQPVDMFPHTHHVENIVLLNQK